MMCCRGTLLIMILVSVVILGLGFSTPFSIEFLFIWENLSIRRISNRVD